MNQACPAYDQPMRNVQVDAEGQFHCWNCGGTNFTHKRTFRSKAAVGVGALLTKKKLKCQQCGSYNDVGSAEAYKGQKVIPGDVAADRTAAAASERRAIDERRAVERKAEALRRRSIKHRPATSANKSRMGWYPDPGGGDFMRYWDGDNWTEHTHADPNR